MALGVVAGQPPAQVAVQRDGVEQRLQPVVGALISAASASGGSASVSGSPAGPSQFVL